MKQSALPTPAADLPFREIQITRSRVACGSPLHGELSVRTKADALSRGAPDHPPASSLPERIPGQLRLQHPPAERKGVGQTTPITS